jgi:N-acetylglucosamine-6-sulfatase
MLKRFLCGGWSLAMLALLALGGAPSSMAGPVQSPNAGVSFALPPLGGGGGAVGQSRPNIVFILTDDLSMDLLRYMPHVQAMEQAGLSFDDYFVSDSLCCPSRSSIFTGQFPHDTGVFSNTGYDGGFQKFHDRGLEQKTFAVALQDAGYRTAMMGKYLNGYLHPQDWSGIRDTYIPRGWSEWDVGGWGYNEFDYNLNEDGVLRWYGHRPADYLTNVLGKRGVEFIDSSAAAQTPFFLELATFAPHFPYTPAPQDANRFEGLTAPRPPSFDRLPTDAPRWLADHGPLSEADINHIDDVFRLRVRDVQSVDRMIGEIEDALSAAGVAGKTYLVFSSDNGLHTGEYRLMPGKMTAFDTDIHVPLVIDGPRIPAGSTTSAVTENIDLAETFAAIGGTEVPDGDGHSLLPLLSGGTPPDWRDAALVEHHGPDTRGFDPDFQQPASGNPRSYEAIRTHGFLYVEYDDGEREYYDLQNDPFELHNLAAQLPAAALAQLHEALMDLETCHGDSCWASGDAGPLRARARTDAPLPRARGGRCLPRFRAASRCSARRRLHS